MHNPNNMTFFFFKYAWKYSDLALKELIKKISYTGMGQIIYREFFF